MSVFRNILAGKAIIPYIRLFPDELSYEEIGGSRTLQVSSNGNWELKFTDNTDKDTQS